MRKNDQSIYLWSFFIVSAIVLALLYTPLGGKLNSGSHGYYIETAPSVNFGGSIANSPKRRAANNSYSPSFSDVPQAVNSNNYMTQRPVVSGGGAAQNSNLNAGNGYAASGIGLSSPAGAGGSGAGGGTGMMAVSGGGRSQSTGNAGGGGGGMMAPFSNDGLSIDGPMKATNNEVSKSDAGADPLGNPLPIGDGSLLLLFFAAIYIFIKNKAKL